MRIACLGDSITYYGSPSAARPPSQELQKLLDAAAPGVHHVANHGIHGDKVTAGIGTRYTSDIAGKSYDALVFLGGINDVAADVTAAAIESAAQAILDAARTAGMTVVLITMSPFGTDATDWTSARQTVWESVNTWYRSYATTNSLQLVDAATLLSDGNTPPGLASGYAYGDGLHWLQAAVDLIAGDVKTALGL